MANAKTYVSSTFKLILGWYAWLKALQDSLDPRDAADAVIAELSPHFDMPGQSGVLNATKTVQREHTEHKLKLSPGSATKGQVKTAVQNATLDEVALGFGKVLQPWAHSLSARAGIAEGLQDSYSLKELRQREIERLRELLKQKEGEMEADDLHGGEDEDDDEVEDSAEEVEEEEDEELVTVPASTKPKAKTKAAKN